MGLDFSHTTARWSYSGFMNFRIKLAKEIGIEDLKQMAGFNGYGSWQAYQDHPLFDFLNHSDCDGDLTPEQMKIIAPAIRDAIKNWSDGDYDKQAATRLCLGMEDAISKNENLEFL